MDLLLPPPILDPNFKIQGGLRVQAGEVVNALGRGERPENPPVPRWPVPGRQEWICSRIEGSAGKAEDTGQAGKAVS